MFKSARSMAREYAGVAETIVGIPIIQKSNSLFSGFPLMKGSSSDKGIIAKSQEVIIFEKKSSFQS
jgi:hypothetical protein